MNRYNRLTIDYNSRTGYNNVYDLYIEETGILGQSNTGTGFYAFTSADFVTNPDSNDRLVDCVAPKLLGLDIRIFWNESTRFLNEDEYALRAGGGFTVLIPDFDAATDNYHFYVSTVAQQITNTSVEPISLADAKAHLRVDFDDDDAIIQRMITMCRLRIENYCNISIVSKQVTATIDLQDMFLYVKLELPMGPVVDIVSFKDYSGNDIDASFYRVIGAQFKYLTATKKPLDSAVIVYTTGYSVVPYDLILAILNELSFRYENRGEGAQVRSNVNPGISDSAAELANAYKREVWR